MSGKRHHIYIIAGLIIGAIAGIAADWAASNSVAVRENLTWITHNITDPIGQVFLRLIFMVVLPLVFSALVLGVVEVGDVRRLGRIGLKTLAYTFVFSTLAVGIGVTTVNVIQPGKMLDPVQQAALRAQYADSAADAVVKSTQAKSIRDTLLDLIPVNPLQEMVGALDGSSRGGGMLAIMFFALVFGIALTLLPDERALPLTSLLRAVFDVCMNIIGFAMKIAPVAVACLVFSVTARVGSDVLTMLLGFAATVLLGLFVQMLVVYPLALKFFAGRSPARFFRDIADVLVTAFATSSSNATLPTSLKCATEDLKLPREIGHFVLTVGATGNQNGTALYEGVVVLFLAQVFGVDLTIGQQITVVLMSVLAGVGTAGVPGGSLPLIAIVCATVGVPPEGIAIILGIDRLLDMVRTTLNVVGDLVIATCVARGSAPTERPVVVPSVAQ